MSGRARNRRRPNEIAYPCRSPFDGRCFVGRLRREPTGRTVADASAPGGVCGSYGYVDVNNDGFISGDEWNTFRAKSYGDWDLNHDGRVSRSEFEKCYRGGGFYRTAYYNPDYWTNYWSAFDANGDGYLSADEYWSAAAWSQIDRNHNGRIDSDEWVWWPH